MSVAQNDVVRVDSIATFNIVDEVVNTYQFRKTDAGTITDANALDDLEAIILQILAIIKALAGAATVWQRIRAQNLTQDTLLGEQIHGAPIVGTNGTASGAPGVAALLSLKTNVPRVVMRKYWGPLAENSINDSGLMGAGQAAVLTDAADLMLVPFTEANGTWEFGYDSPKVGGWITPQSASFTLVPAYQRRRRQGVGS